MELPDQLQFIINRKAALHTTSDSVKGKRILLTGATSGIGLASAQRLCRDEIELIMIVRNLEKGETLKKQLEESTNSKVFVFVADMSDLETVLRVSKEIINQFDAIDVLIHNAGIHSTRRLLSKQGYELSFAINYLASFLLTIKLLPLLEKGKNPHILYVNSEGHRFGDVNLNDLHFHQRHYTGLKGYGQSKTAQLLAILHLKDELFSKGIRINAMHPGDVKSNIGKNNGLIYRTFSKYFIQPFLQDVHRASDAMHYLIAHSGLHQTTGLFFHLTTIEKPADYTLNQSKANGLIALSYEIIQPFL